MVMEPLNLNIYWLQFYKTQCVYRASLFFLRSKALSNHRTGKLCYLDAKISPAQSLNILATLQSWARLKYQVRKLSCICNFCKLICLILFVSFLHILHTAELAGSVSGKSGPLFCAFLEPSMKQGLQ